MEQGLSLEAVSYAYSEETHCHLGKSEVCSCVHKSPQLICILS